MFLTRNQYETFLMNNSLLSSSAPDTSLLLSLRPVSGLLGVRGGNLWRLRGLPASETRSSGEDGGVKSPVSMMGYQGVMTVVELQHDTCHTSVTTDKRKHRVGRYYLAAICWSQPEISVQCQVIIGTFTSSVFSLLSCIYKTVFKKLKILNEFSFFQWGFSW